MKKPAKKPTSKKLTRQKKAIMAPATVLSGIAKDTVSRGGQYAAPSIEDNAAMLYGTPAKVSNHIAKLAADGDRRATLAEKIAEKRAAAGPKSDLKPTAEQGKVIEKVAGGFKVLVLIAGAGAGKTSTLRMVADNMEGNGQYTAFNNSLVADSATKFQGTTVACNTTHSLAFRAIGSKYAHRLGGQRIKSDRVAAILGIKEFSCQLPGAEVDGKPVVKRLPGSLLASFVMGAIKKFCQSADKLIAASHFRYVDGIDYPPGTTTNNDKLREYLLPYARKAWQDITNTQGTLPFAHDHYVKIWQLSNPVIPADYILLDECFPAGTMIETTDGIVPIERIAENPSNGWRVLTSVDGGKTLGYSAVRSAYKTPTAQPLVKVTHAKDTIYCTANHPLWVRQKGWTPAGLVEEGDSLSYLREPNPAETKDVFQVLRREMAGRQPITGEGESAAGQDCQDNEASLYNETKSYESPRDSQQSLSDPQGTGNYVSSKGRQWEGANSAAVDTLPGTRKIATELAMEPRICQLEWQAHEGNADLLQDRHSVADKTDSNRSGWRVPQADNSQGGGYQEGQGTEVSRVASVEVYQPTDRGESKSNSSSSQQYVYTLSTVAGTYFADGLLVKNCQDTAPVMLSILEQQTCPIILVGDEAQQIYEWRGAVNAMEAFPDAERCYLTQSFRFGQKIADVANAILKTFDKPTDLRLRGLETLDSKVEKIAEPTAILCRTNAVAISSMLNALALGKKPFLVGGTSDVISFVQAIQDLQQGKSTSHPELACFDSWTEVQEYAKSEDGGDLQLMVKLIAAFGCVTILNALKSMPLEADADLVISTAHKSKGRQWAKVKVASDFPTKSKSTDADRKLLYVTCTRAQEVLDVTSCPFFTGNDAIDLLGAEGKVAAPFNATPPTMYTWAKGENDTWLVRGPKGMSGKTVEIVSKASKRAYRRLGQEVSSNEVAALYRV